MGYGGSKKSTKKTTTKKPYGLSKTVPGSNVPYVGGTGSYKKKKVTASGKKKAEAAKAYAKNKALERKANYKKAVARKKK